jgi:uncharacterized membrane-anchored protein YhcB (DUF1043 family)
MDTNWVLIGLIVLIGVLIAMIVMVLRLFTSKLSEDAKRLYEFTVATNNNVALKDSIEYAAMATPQPVVDSIVGMGTLLLNMVGYIVLKDQPEAYAEFQKAVREMQKFKKDVTDGLPNTADGGDVVAKG